MAMLAPVHSSSVAETVAASLREAIIEGVLAPGSHLVERPIGERLGVSNIAIREAFALLSEEGFVVRRPRKGTFVTPVSPESVRDLTRVRVTLEQLVVELAIERWGPEHTAQVEAVLAEMERAVQIQNRQLIFEADNAFHRLFWELSGSPVLLELSSRIRGRIARLIREAMARSSTDIEALVPLHRAWLDAVISGDPRQARAEVERHILPAAESIIRRLEAADGSAEPEPHRTP